MTGPPTPDTVKRLFYYHYNYYMIANPEILLYNYPAQSGKSMPSATSKIPLMFFKMKLKSASHTTVLKVRCSNTVQSQYVLI